MTNAATDSVWSALGVERRQRTHSLVVYFTKGLGDIAVEEIREIAPGARVRQEAERFAIVDAPGADVERMIAGCRTLDDLRLLLVGPITVETEHDLALACEQAAQRVRDALSGRAGCPWSVTLSARNPPWRLGDGWEPAPLFERHLCASTADTTRHTIDLRIQVDDHALHIALSLLPDPIGKRPQERGVDRAAALRPTVAAALVRIAMRLDDRVRSRGIYDPMCGSGTIVLEAARAGLPVFGSDIDAAAVAAVRARLLAVGDESPGRRQIDRAVVLEHRLFVHDVLRGFPSRVDATVVVTNPPWGKQLRLERRTALLDAIARTIDHEVAAGGGAVVITAHGPDLAARVRRRVGDASITMRQVGLLGQTPTIVTVGSGS